jgi:hypothetical protein
MRRRKRAFWKTERRHGTAKNEVASSGMPNSVVECGGSTPLLTVRLDAPPASPGMESLPTARSHRLQQFKENCGRNKAQKTQK